ncbi:MAG: TraB/GumN family protein [Oscillospiraceae bacterium]|nr:TraB/GumN family protein [Oscillospiraceae bacterium]
MKRRLLALLLAALMIFSLFGCDKEVPEDQTDTSEQVQEDPPPPPEPTAEEVYGEAAALLEGKADITLDISENMSVTSGHLHVADTSSAFVVAYNGLDTESPVILMEESVDYSNFLLTASGEASEEDLRVYSETYADGTLYVELEDIVAFSGSLTAEKALSRYIPVVLLDASLYEELSVSESGGQKTVTFASPTAAESWVIPESAEMLDASGSVVIGADGAIVQMNYNITYKYGSTEVVYEIESAPRAEALTVEAPQNPYRFKAVDGIDALWLTLYSGNALYEAGTYSMHNSEQTLSQAGGIVYMQQSDIDMYTNEDRFLSAVDATINVYESSGMTTVEQRETYIDGKYTSVVDNGVPTTQTGITEEQMSEYCRSSLYLNVTTPEFWENVTIEDLGSIYYLEFTYDQNMADTFQNAICTTFWNDAAILNNMASDYRTNEMSGYIAIDKYTRMITAYGVYYEGVHTIEGGEYILSSQLDQSFELPSFGAYEAIMEEPMPEAEPEDKATPLLYHVTGEDGQEMWLFGTIHVGDSRTAYLPQEIYDAFNASDALALEFDSEAFEKQIEEDSSLALKYANILFYTDGSSLEGKIEEEDYARAVKLMKASGNYNENLLLAKPYVWESSIQNFYLQQGHLLTSEQGMESRLTKMANDQEKPIYEVESGLFQISMVTGWSEELQLLLLDEVMYGDPEEYITDTAELYELWCDGDETALYEELNEDVDTSEFTDEELAEYNANLPLYDEYDKAMSYDRNEGMLDVAISYLESDEVVFYAVGLAHLLDGTNGLVYTLREAGYTVELVTYN